MFLSLQNKALINWIRPIFCQKTVIVNASGPKKRNRRWLKSSHISYHWTTRVLELYKTDTVKYPVPQWVKTPRKKHQIFKKSRRSRHRQPMELMTTPSNLIRMNSATIPRRSNHCQSQSWVRLKNLGCVCWRRYHNKYKLQKDHPIKECRHR